ncbi:hypothetical protein BH09DEP1_BH09DEP1_4920 [soil metagenome]
MHKLFFYLLTIPTSVLSMHRSPEEILANQEHQAKFKRKMLDAAEQVIKKQRDANEKVDQRYLPLCQSCESDEHLALTRQLLACHARPNLQDLWYPLNASAEHLCIETTQLLLSYEADTGLQSAYMLQTPLHSLCTKVSNDPDRIAKKITLAKLLLHARAPLHAKNRLNETPFDSVYAHAKTDPCCAALAKLLLSEARYRLLVEIQSNRIKNGASHFNLLPKDIVKKIVFHVYPFLPKPPIVQSK